MTPKTTLHTTIPMISSLSGANCQFEKRMRLLFQNFKKQRRGKGAFYKYIKVELPDRCKKQLFALFNPILCNVEKDFADQFNYDRWSDPMSSFSWSTKTGKRVKSRSISICKRAPTRFCAKLKRVLLTSPRPRTTGRCRSRKPLSV